MKWPVSELAYWAAHFELEYEEYERAKQQWQTGGGQVVELSTNDDPIELQANAVMAVF